MFVGGLAYHPNDYAELAQRLRGTNTVVHNPLHTGEVKWNAEWLREAYARIFMQSSCDSIVAHSLGCLDAVHLKRVLGDSVQSLVCITPPLSPIEGVTNTPRFDRDINDPLRQIDCVLSDLCAGDMTEEEYNAFLSEHYALYGHRLKANYKEGMPKFDQIPSLIERMVTEIRSFQNCRVLALVGAKDVWAPKSDDLLPDLGEHSTIKKMESSHYPHRVYPAMVADEIMKWESVF
jgi:pimeloyl-ACP methyl ester carboxylesterase